MLKTWKISNTTGKEKRGKDKMFQLVEKIFSCICVTLEGKAATKPATFHGQGHKQEKT